MILYFLKGENNMKTISIKLDLEQQHYIEDLKQDFFEKNQVDITTTQLFKKLLFDAWDNIQQKN